MSAKQLRFSYEPSPDVAATDGAGYRDYLWAIWTVAASNEVGNGVHLSGKDARRQLENRFHQDFRTVDDALRSADEVAVGVLTQLLLPPTSVGFGLGVAPGAISRTESVVTQSCMRTVMQRIVDRDHHVIDNAKDPTDHIVGVHRWVDKVQRMQVFRFPNCYLLDFEIPELAAFVRWLADNKPKPVGVRTEPIPLTDTGKKDGKALTVEDMTVETCAGYVARYSVTRLPDAQARHLSVTESWVIDAGDRKAEIGNYDSIPFAPAGAKDKELAISDDYAAVSAVAAASAAPQLARWKGWTDWDSQSPDGGRANEESGLHEVVATIEVADRTTLDSTEDRDTKLGNTVDKQPRVYHDFWLNKEFQWDKAGVPQRQLEFDTRPTGKTSVSGSIGAPYKGSISVSLTCAPTEATWLNWRTEVFARISPAYTDQLARWQSELGYVHVGSAPGGVLARSASPPHDARPRAKSPVRPHPSTSEPRHDRHRPDRPRACVS